MWILWRSGCISLCSKFLVNCRVPLHTIHITFLFLLRVRKWNNLYKCTKRQLFYWRSYMGLSSRIFKTFYNWNKFLWTVQNLINHIKQLTNPEVSLFHSLCLNKLKNYEFHTIVNCVLSNFQSNLQSDLEFFWKRRNLRHFLQKIEFPKLSCVENTHGLFNYFHALCKYVYWGLVNFLVNHLFI